MKYKALLFDMDGVLIDSEYLMRKSAGLALKDFGVNSKEEDFFPFTGRGEDLFIGGVAEKYGVNYDVAMKARAYYYFGEYVDVDATVPEGLLDVLKSIKDMGIKIAVCTSADYAKVVHNLKAMKTDETFFDAFITGDEIKVKKPDPEIYLKGAAKVGFDPSECLVVEDAPSGIKAGRAGGMDTVAITSSFTAQELKESCAPDMIIDRLQELLDIVK